jgi:hypothetical protein
MRFLTFEQFKTAVINDCGGLVIEPECFTNRADDTSTLDNSFEYVTYSFYYVLTSEGEWRYSGGRGSIGTGETLKAAVDEESRQYEEAALLYEAISP